MLRDHSDTSQDPATGRTDPRLDEGTKLPGGMWGLRWWPDAGEAVVFVASMGPLDQDQVADEIADTVSLDPRAVERRDRENRERAARRGRSKVRRYVVANGCSRMVTLTFAPTPGRNDSQATNPREAACGQRRTGGPPDQCVGPSSPQAAGLEPDAYCACGRPRGGRGLVAAMRLAAGFILRVRQELGGAAFPYVVVPEFHKDGHVHLHVLVDRFIPKPVLARLWGLGWVDVKRFTAENGQGARAAARRAAHYASKYVSKTFDEAPGNLGRHRYEVGEGFQPLVVKRGGYRSTHAAVDFVTGHGCEVIYAVSSDEVEDYEGPPFLWVLLETSA